MKRILILLVMAVVVMAFAFALDGNVTWYWFENDPNVEYYRYQLDGEFDGYWTVVDWAVTDVTLTVDISEVHTLYLQQSYDGENWSESSFIDSEVFEEELPVEEPVEETFDDFFVVEEPVVEDFEWDSFEAIGPTAVHEADLIADETPVQKKRGEICLDYGFGYLDYIPDSKGPKSLGAFLSYSHMLDSLETGAVGIKANLALYSNKNIVFDIAHTQMMSYMNILALYSVKVGNSDLFAGIGPDFRFTMFNDAKAKLGMAVEAGIRFHRTESSLIGLVVSDHYYLVPSKDMTNAFDVRVFMTKAL